MKGEQSFMEKAFWATQDSTISQMIKPMYARGLEKLDAFTDEKMKKICCSCRWSYRTWGRVLYVQCYCFFNSYNS